MFLQHKVTLFLGICWLVIGMTSSVQANSIFSESQKSEIKSIIYDYITRDPNVIRDALINLRKEEIAKKVERQKLTLRNKNSEIFNNQADVVTGNKDGDVTLVLFFDYNCIYCRQLLPPISKLLASDPNLRLVLKEFPILGAGSLDTSRLAIASIKQGKYLKYHHALLSYDKSLDKQSALKIAKRVGLNVTRLVLDAQADEINNILQNTMKLSSNLSIMSTPSYILGDTVMDGTVTIDTLKAKIEELRKNNKTERKK